jgi:hypothetical protein
VPDEDLVVPIPGGVEEIMERLGGVTRGVDDPEVMPLGDLVVVEFDFLGLLLDDEDLVEGVLGERVVGDL